MTCEEIRDLIPSYALGTATDDEIAKIEEHIASCRLHDSEIEEAMQSSGLLAMAADPKKPPDGLRDRVMAHARAGSQAGPVKGNSALSIFRRSALRVNALAASLVVVIGVLIAWNLMLQTADQPEKFTHYYWGMDSDWLRLETVLGEPGAEISLGGIERLDDQHLYHLWSTRDEDTLFVSVFNVSSEGRWAGDVEFTFEAGDRLWVTIEPVGGDSGPTGDPVLRTRF